MRAERVAVVYAGQAADRLSVKKGKIRIIQKPVADKKNEREERN